MTPEIIARFTALTEEMRPYLVRVARRLNTGDSAEDAVQDALLSAWKGLHQVKEVQALQHWLYMVTIRHIHKTYRQLNAGKVNVSISSSVTVDGEIQEMQIPDKAMNALDVLLDVEREDYLDDLMEGLPPSQLAAVKNFLAGESNDSALIKAKHHAVLQLRSGVQGLQSDPNEPYQMHMLGLMGVAA